MFCSRFTEFRVTDLVNSHFKRTSSDRLDHLLSDFAHHHGSKTRIYKAWNYFFPLSCNSNIRKKNMMLIKRYFSCKLFLLNHIVGCSFKIMLIVGKMRNRHNKAKPFVSPLYPNPNNQKIESAVLRS